MIIRPSKWQEYTIRDFLYFYGILTFVPFLAIGSYFAIFMGPATLETIPEDYLPKEEEYEQKFIPRLFIRYVYPSFQQVYEMRLHNVYQEEKKYKRNELLKEISRLMGEVGDSKAFYYHPSYAKHLRRALESDKIIKDRLGDP
nr:NADH dehydrogenase 1 beta subcomplex subunit 5, mitochondrial precursor [Caligus rogercresseyi]